MAPLYTAAQARAALSQTGLIPDGESPESFPRENRLALRLAGDRIAWFPTNPEGQALLTKERRVLRLLETHCHFQAPRVLYEDEAGWDLRKLVPGAVQPAGLRERLRDARFAFLFGQDLGRILADQHAAVPSPDLEGWLPRVPSWPRPEDLPHLQQVVRDPTLLGQIDLALERRAGLECPHDRCVLIHGDLGLHNVVVDPDSLRVTGVFDYEGAFCGDPHQDFAYLVFQQPQEPMLDGALEVYESATGTRIARDRVLLLNAVAAIGFLAFRHGHSPDEAWCGRTLAEDLAWTRAALSSAGL